MYFFAIIGLITVVVIIVLAVQSVQSNSDSDVNPIPRPSQTPAVSSSPIPHPTPSPKKPTLEEIHSIWKFHAQQLFDYVETMRSVNYISEDIIFESLIAFYIISLTFSNKRFDASSVLSDFYMSEVFEEPIFCEYKNKFWPRVRLYQQALQTKKIRCECLPNLPDSEKNNLDSMSQIMLIYGDLLWNPSCSSDYVNAPNRPMNAYEYALFLPEYMDGLHNVFANFAEHWDQYTKSLT